ncbi:folate-binding protein YgfZ [Aurantimonas sp. VKM B-3413]|uniref:CAF17-like 4Fe-4S cluster assembly/insertion protein YgfZ n=1 Tax=Aurantimonas sp. VKM B-3413 TaxID=2779401 RepID=UPI001E40D6DD|nr:folate-binding protein YgfZ [Aurantimonas sp. VKM B-3413]MCB8836039.1 folate-binding protein YgfZ [Aurantimonas sp. VKM B-3413]
MPYAPLPDRALLAVTGETAEPFLQNLITTDLDTLEPGEMRPSALLTPQGKILFEFLVGRIGGGFRLDCAESAAEDLKKRLGLYRLRAKVAIEPEDLSVFAAWSENAAQLPGALVDRRFAGGDVVRIHGEVPGGLDQAPAEDFRALRLRAGIAEAEADYPGSDVFPHDVLLDQNGGVSFKKGCFVGQEVVSRMQHRGTARRRLMLVSSDQHLTPGSDVIAGSKAIGTILSATDRDGIALMRIDRLAEALASGEALTADGVAVEMTIPPWAGFSLPEISSTAAPESAE